MYVKAIFFKSIFLGMATLVLASELNTFKSKVYHFQVSYPTSWQLSGGPEHFQIDNFPLSQSIRGNRIPVGYASILVSVPEETSRRTPQTLQQWIQQEYRGRPVMERKDIEVLTRGRTKLGITQVTSQCCAVPPYRHDVTWYFKRDSRLFSSTLIYYEGDPKSKSYLEQLRIIATSVRPYVG